MWRRILATILALAVPASLSAESLKDAIDKAGRDIASVQRPDQPHSRTRMWTGIALISAGGVLAALGAVEIGDDETGPDDGEDSDNSDDGEDSDGWGNKALLGTGIAAATVGGVLLLTGKKSGPRVSVGRGRAVVRYTVRF